MPTASITAAYVNEPKSATGPGNIKTADGRYFKVWKQSKFPGQATLADFKANSTYDIEYDEEAPYNGRPSYMIKKIVSASSTTTSTNGNGHPDASAAHRYSDTRSNDIKWLACLKIAGLVYAGAGATVPLPKIIEVARSIYNEPIDIVDEAKALFNVTDEKLF